MNFDTRYIEDIFSEQLRRLKIDDSIIKKRRGDKNGYLRNY